MKIQEKHDKKRNNLRKKDEIIRDIGNKKYNKMKKNYKKERDKKK